MGRLFCHWVSLPLTCLYDIQTNKSSRYGSRRGIHPPVSGPPRRKRRLQPCQVGRNPYNAPIRRPRPGAERTVSANHS
ncbi:hypothetical protein BF49_0987 [Bradyrhizobium sp.]|nr:hypothetical protein BF49_0987 [Bradyrhizobium sp.]